MQAYLGADLVLVVVDGLSYAARVGAGLRSLCVNLGIALSVGALIGAALVVLGCAVATGCTVAAAAAAATALLALLALLTLVTLSIEWGSSSGSWWRSLRMSIGGSQPSLATALRLPSPCG